MPSSLRFMATLFALVVVPSLPCMPWAHGQEKQPPAGPGTHIAKLAEAVPAVQTLVKGPWTKNWVSQVTRLPSIEPTKLAVNEREVAVDEAFYYSGRFGSPLAYARALDLAEQHGFQPSPQARVVDFGYGSIGQLRMFALAGLAAYGIDPSELSSKLYRDAEGKLGEGSVKLFQDSFPASEKLRQELGDGFDLFLSKNTLKRGYIHPSRPVSDPRMLIQLGVDDREFLRQVHRLLKPNGLFVMYNFCPAKASQDQKYLPWSEGESPFSQADMTQAGFEVLAFDVVDDVEARKLAHALGWDTEDKMDLEQDLFAWYTIVKRVGE